MRVKTCGIRNEAEAALAVSLEADALGFLIGLNYPTDDEVAPAVAGHIIAALPPFLSSVLVTHRTDAEWVADTCRSIGCSAVQLHGDFPLEQIPVLRRMVPHVRIIKVVHVVDAQSVARATLAARWADAVQLDTKTGTRIGGTGKTHDWSISAQIVKAVHKPVILSGGLRPENIHQAIRMVRPYAVDVNSGVENPDGSKSAVKMESFIRLAREVSSDLVLEGAPQPGWTAARPPS